MSYLPGVPAAVFTPTSLRFGNVKAGTTKTLSTTVKNAGTAPLAISSIGLSGTRYSIVPTAQACSTTAPVDPGTSCTISVKFTPAARTRSLGTLTVTSNAGRDTVPLSGRG